MNPDRRAALAIPILLVLLSGVIRIVQLDHPDRIIFDETYYVNDARDYIKQGVEEGFAVHPPVGKWLIAGGIAVFGDDSFGWRISGALAGTLTVLLTYLIGMRLFRARGAAAFAALLVSVDGLLFVQSRTSMLDIFLAMFVALGAWLLLVDRDRTRLLDEDDISTRRLAREDVETLEAEEALIAGGSSDQPRPWSDDVPDTGPAPVPVPVASQPHLDYQEWLAAQRPTQPHVPRVGHGIRLLAGVAFGLACATKWSGALALAAAVVITITWELAWRRRVTGAATRDLGPLAASLVGAFVLIPLAVYFVSYTPWLVNYHDTTEGKKVCTEEELEKGPCSVDPFGRVQGLIRYQKAIYNFHRDLEATHPYRSEAWKWPLLIRPVVYYYEGCDEKRASLTTAVTSTNSEGEEEVDEPCVVGLSNAAEIIALGNPVVWWLGLLAMIPVLIGLWRGDQRAWFMFAFWVWQFAPWLLEDRPLFYFYMTPVVAFIGLILGYTVVFLDEGRQERLRQGAVPVWAIAPGTLFGVIVSVLAVAMFLYFYPVYSGIELDYELVRQHWWLKTWV